MHTVDVMENTKIYPTIEKCPAAPHVRGGVVVHVEPHVLGPAVLEQLLVLVPGGAARGRTRGWEERTLTCRKNVS